jgi:hypothetical protein
MTNAAVAVTNQDVVSAIQSTSDAAQRDERITTILLSGNGPIGAVTHNICRALLPFLSDHRHQEWRDDKSKLGSDTIYEILVQAAQRARQ